MNQLPKLVICIDWFLPGYKAGGPIRSVVNLIDILAEDYEIYVITSAYDLGEDEPYQNIQINEWIAYEQYHIKYLDRKRMSNRVIKSNIELIAPDYVYLNSLFSVNFTFHPLRAAQKLKNKPKIIIAPRGMFGSDSLSIKSRKKQLFLKLAKLIGFFKGVLWHATTEDERKAIKYYFPKAHVSKVIPNLARKVSKNINQAIEKKQDYDHLKVCFVSRISEIKNLEFAIDVLSACKDFKPIIFNIYGAFESEGYYNKITQLAEREKNVKINFHGALHPDEIPEVFSNHHLHFIPTKHENYGHSIVESWANGCPVLTSQNTPWSKLEQQQVGWDLPLDDKEKFIEAIKKMINMDVTTYNKWVASCFQFYRSFVIRDEDIAAYKSELFS